MEDSEIKKLKKLREGLDKIKLAFFFLIGNFTSDVVEIFD